MKQVNIYMPQLKYGGMELSLINFINNSNICNEYNVNLYLIFARNRELINNIDDRVNIHEITGNWSVIGKLITALKLSIMYIKPPKSDISICYSNHHKILSDLTRKSSNNSILFVHSDLNRYQTKKEQKKIKKKIKFDKFKKIICVSSVVKNSLINLYDENIGDRCFIVPNYVDGEKIIKLSKESISDSIDFKIPTFINIANHVEEYKNISAIIKAAATLKKEKLSFQILLIGEGKDTESYKRMIEMLKLNNYVKILGSKSNPYSYLKKSKALLFTSKFEGYGMVLDEARVLNIPIISTGSGASYDICKDGYGVITDDIEKEIKKVLMTSSKKVIKFDYKKHNENITKQYKEIIK